MTILITWVRCVTDWESDWNLFLEMMLIITSLNYKTVRQNDWITFILKIITFILYTELPLYTWWNNSFEVIQWQNFENIENIGYISKISWHFRYFRYFDIFENIIIFSNPGGIAVISCLSVRLSVALVDCDHMRWNSSKIISRMISLGTWLSADPKWWVYSKGNTPKF